MGVISAGISIDRQAGSGAELLLGHPGGPLWARKDEVAGIAPKGLIESGEAPLAAPRREFREETGLVPPTTLQALAPRNSPAARPSWSGLAKRTSICRPSHPVRSKWNGRPNRENEAEIDRIAYFATVAALTKILASQTPRLRDALRLHGRRD